MHKITNIKHIKSMQNDKYTELIKFMLLINYQKAVEACLDKEITKTFLDLSSYHIILKLLLNSRKRRYMGCNRCIKCLSFCTLSLQGSFHLSEESIYLSIPFENIKLFMGDVENIFAVHCIKLNYVIFTLT